MTHDAMTTSLPAYRIDGRLTLIERGPAGRTLHTRNGTQTISNRHWTHMRSARSGRVVEAVQVTDHYSRGQWQAARIGRIPYSQAVHAIEQHIATVDDEIDRLEEEQEKLQRKERSGRISDYDAARLADVQEQLRRLES